MRPRRLGTDKQMAHTSSSGSADQAGHFGSTSLSTTAGAIVVVVIIITLLVRFGAFLYHPVCVYVLLLLPNEQY